MPTTRTAKYETDGGSIFNVRFEFTDETDDISGTPPTGALTENVQLRVTKNRKEVGIRPRVAQLYRTVGTEGTVTNCLVQAGKMYKYVPILTRAHADGLTPGTKFTIRGTEYTFNKVLQEQTL